MKKKVIVTCSCFLAVATLLPYGCGSVEDDLGCVSGVWENNYSHSTLAVRLTGQDNGYREIDINSTTGSTFSYFFENVPVGNNYFLECGQVNSSSRAWLRDDRSVMISVRPGQTTRLDCNLVYAMPPTEGPFFDDGCFR